MRRSTLLLCLALMLVPRGPVLADTKVEERLRAERAKELPEYVLGAPVANPFEIKGKRIPLPPGNWVLAGKELLMPDAVAPIAAFVLADIDPAAKKLKMAVQIRANTKPSIGLGMVGWKRCLECERRDIHFTETYANYDGNEQDCWWINHIRMTVRGNALGYYTDALDYLSDQGIMIPLTMISVGYRFASKLDFVHVHFYHNPEMAGFAPPEYVEWASSDWHRNRIGWDRKKVAYIEEMRQWGRMWHEKMKIGFKGGDPAKAPVAKKAPKVSMDPVEAMDLRQVRATSGK